MTIQSINAYRPAARQPLPAPLPAAPNGTLSEAEIRQIIQDTLG